MINFLKKVRKKLLIKNKITDYLFYSIGEIVLVVLGILIALAVNSWNEGRKDSIKKKELLKSLKVEFELNLKQLDTVLYYDIRVVNSSRKLLDIKKEDMSSLNLDTIKSIIQNTSWLWTFDPMNGALRSSISSGTVHLLNNDSLINKLFSWEDVVYDAKENEDRSLEMRLESKYIIEKHIRIRDYRGVENKELGKSKFNSDYHALLKDPLFEDYITERFTSMDEAVLELNLVRRQNTLILDLIQKELNSYK